MMRPMLAAILFATIVGGRAVLAEPAPETRTLSDLNLPGEWIADQWNKAQGRVGVRPEFPAGLAIPGGATEGSSLGIKINFVGGSPNAFEFFSIHPGATQELIPFKVLNASIWIKGSGRGQYMELHFTDATGQDVKVGVGQMDFADWRKVSAPIPASWAQPLTFKSLTFHNWHMPEPADITIYATRLEVTVDTAQPLNAGASSAPAKTDDAW